MPPAVGIGVAGALGAGASIFGSRQASRAAGRAGAAQEEAAREAIEEQRRQFDLIQERERPFIEAGRRALPLLESFTQPGFVSPGFQFRQEQGERGINRALSARGLFGSGFGVQELERFNRELTAEEENLKFGRLMDLLNIGRGAAGFAGQAGLATGGRVSGLFGDIGTARAQALLGQGQARAGLFSDIAGGVSQLPTNIALLNYLNRLPGGSVSGRTDTTGGLPFSTGGGGGGVYGGYTGLPGGGIPF